MLAALVLLLGLPRLLVLCEHGDGDSHLTFASSTEHCCSEADTQPEPSVPGGSGGDTASAASGCEHTSFLVELLPPNPPSQPLPLCGPPLPIAPDFVLPTTARTPRLPCATGPPRPDPGLGARATIRLQL
jgi:hypothetical protein